VADFDVVIAGAGPAGSATAISLAAFAPRLRVALIAAPSPEAVPVGETLPPQIKPILQHLDVWEAFTADGHRPSYRTVSAWGGAELLSNEFLVQTQQTGWRLDRARFNAMLAAKAAQHATLVAAKIQTATHAQAEWRLRLDDGARCAARFIVDATGRGAHVARAQGMRFATPDRLVGIAMLFGDCSEDGHGLMVETCPDGWWYTAALPQGRRVVVAMTDADLVRGAGLNARAGFVRALGATHHVSAAAANARALGDPMLRPAGSRHITRETLLPLLCVGDAASCFDPVSGQGLFKALRSGVFASYAIADHLERRDDDGLRRYAALVRSEFAAYRATLRDYYAQERRWPERPFWARRHAGSPVRQDTRGVAATQSL
jgi:2-polyprenyl-6-methoxyphenol hydroxylase-like FAD-dependent oxidoreductase